jgi:hypothetical protein
VEHRVVACQHCEVHGLMRRLEAEMLAVVRYGSRNVTDGKGRDRLVKTRGSASSSGAHTHSLPDAATECPSRTRTYPYSHSMRRAAST